MSEENIWSAFEQLQRTVYRQGKYIEELQERLVDLEQDRIPRLEAQTLKPTEVEQKKVA